VQSILAIISFVVLLAFPIVSAMLFWNNFELLTDKEVMLKYYAYYTDLDLTESAHVVWYPVYFMLRRLMLGLTIVFLDQTVIWQIASKTTLVLTSVFLVGKIKPFNDPFKNWMEQLNEALLMFVVYHIMCFTPFL